MPDTQVVSNITDRTLTIVRVLDAPRELVWQAWTEPAQFTRWAGCGGHSMPLSTIAMDVRPGGEFRYTMVNETTGEEYPTAAIYREVVAPERLVWAYPDESEEVVATVMLTDLGDGRTKMHFEQVGFGLAAHEAGLRDTRAGMAEEIDKLAHYLQTVTSSSPAQ